MQTTETPAAPASLAAAAKALTPAPLLTSIARADLPRLGESIPEFGGLVAALMPGRRISAGHPDYLIVLPEGPQYEAIDIEFGPRGHRVDGADHDVDGLANTMALINSGIDHPAARFCRELSIAGTADFYLPARHELRACYLNAPDLFSHHGDYWTSTQSGSDGAWFQDFSLGVQDIDYKDWKQRCRAVRRVFIDSPL